MNLYESIEDFSNIFLHLCYVFPEEDMHWDFFKEKFQHLIQIFFKQYEFESLVKSYSPTFINHDTSIVSKEGSITPFIPYPPPFDVGIGKFVNQIVDLFIWDLIQENFECRVKTNPLTF